ncbi:MAG: hypothetical protein IJI54_04820 [Kiritimatiellae bacterium]|nr:hypothetical protein [Kiritimatiellia bacterium]
MAIWISVLGDVHCGFLAIMTGAFFIRAYFETTETTCKNNFFFSPRNYTAFLNRRAVARRKGKLFQTSCFPSLEDVVVNYTDAPHHDGRISYENKCQ